MKLKWISGILLTVFVVSVATFYAVLSSYDYNALKPQISRTVKDNTGRDLTLGGDINLKLGLTPTLVVENVSFQNAPWGSQPAMAKIKQFEIKVSLFPLISRRIEIKRLVLIRPEILLEIDKSGRSNLAFETLEKKEQASKEDDSGAGKKWNLSSLTFNEFQIIDGRISRIDHALKKAYTVTVNKLTAKAANNESPVNINFTGAYNGLPLEVAGNLCPLRAFINPGRAWPLNISVKSNGAVLAVEGTMKNPISAKGIELNFALKGRELEDLKQFAGESLFLSGPYDVSGRITDIAPSVYSIKSLKIMLGESDLSGSLEFNLARVRPKITAILSAKKLDFRSLINSKQTPGNAAGKSGKAAKKKEKIFSNEPLLLDVLKQLDADVKIQSSRILLPNRTLDDFEMGMLLRDGVLSIRPLKAVLGKGSMNGRLSVQPMGKVAAASIALKIDKADINFFTKEIKDAQPIEGSVDIDIDLNARGTSIAGMMAALNGRTVVVMGKGKINNKQLDAIGGNFASVMLSIFNPFYKDAQHTSINCFVSGFDVKDGIASTTALVLNTDRMIVVGEGEINLKTEGLDMSLRPVSKKGSGSDVTERLTGSLGELARPFKLSGTLANPSLAIDPTQTAIVAGKLLGGTALFGPAGVAAALIGGDSESESSCVAAISAARKGVRTKKSFGADKVQGGAGQTFKDAGKELKRLFRR